MDKPIEMIKKGDYTAEIYSEEDLFETPRDWDNMGHMICFHRGYTLGDKTDLKSDRFDGWKELMEYLVKEKKARIIMPLYLYDHSGISMKVGSFAGLLPQGHAEFDSGQVGFIYATDMDIRENYLVKRITKTILARAEGLLKAEVETYNQYLTGEVYYYKITKHVKGMHNDCVHCKKPLEVPEPYEEDVDVDSCGGIYGWKDTIKEVNSILDHLIKEDEKKGQVLVEVVR